MRIRTLFLLVLLIASAALLGCTAGARNLPTQDHPITMAVLNEQTGLMFGGEDGTARVFVPYTDVGPMAVSPNARVAAIYTGGGAGRKGSLTFYGPSKQVIATVDLGTAGSWFGAGVYGSMWLSDLGEAVLVGGPIEGSRARSLAPSVDGTLYVEALYVTKAGAAQSFALHGGVRQIQFLESPGFAVLQWAHYGRGDTLDAWLLSRFASPTDLSWEVMIMTSEFAYLACEGPVKQRLFKELEQMQGGDYWARKFPPSSSEFDVSVILYEGNLRFRPDATYAFENVRPARRSLSGGNKRSAPFYETAFLPKALDQLAEAAAITPAERPQVQDALRGFIRDYLEACEKDGLRISPESHRACLKRLDDAMAALLRPDKRMNYLSWRSGDPAGGNPMGFMFRPPVVGPPENSFWVNVTVPPAKK